MRTATLMPGRCQETLRRASQAGTEDEGAGCRGCTPSPEDREPPSVPMFTKSKEPLRAGGRPPQPVVTPTGRAGVGGQ